MPETIVDLGELFCLDLIVGPKPERSMLPVPVLFAFAEKADETDNTNTLHTLGLGYLTGDLVEYPFTITTVIGNHTFRSWSQDDVYCFPFALLDDKLVSSYIVCLANRETGKYMETRSMAGDETVSLRNNVSDDTIMVSVPAMFRTARLKDVRYKIKGGCIFENKGNFDWNRTYPYDVMGQNQ